MLLDQDKKEILKAYCSELADILLDVEDIIEVKTVSELIDTARKAYEYAVENCENEYNKEECVKENIKRKFIIEDPDEASKQLEKKIREGLLDLKDKYGIDYVHPKGKRIEYEKEKEKEKFVTADLYLVVGDKAYIGDVKLSNKESLENIENMEKLTSLEKYEGHQVVKFIISNSSNVDLPSFQVIKFKNNEIKKVLESNDKKTIMEFTEEILKKLGINKKSV